MTQFESTIREIFYLVGEYGITNTPDFKRTGLSDEKKKQFLINCRKGFRLGQNLIVKETVKVLEEIKKHKLLEKEAKKRKNNEERKLLEIELGELNWKLALLKHFADFLAWLFFRNEWHKIRRFYSGSKSRPNLLESNLPSVLESVEYFHSQDDLNFALICDLTTFMDIGDILLVTENKLVIVECKSGDVQRRIYDFIEQLREDEFDPAKIDYSDKDIKFFDQLERTLRQQERGSNAMSFFNTEKGIDPFLKKEIHLLTSDAVPDYYYNVLVRAAEDSLKEDSAYARIEDIIYIAAYRNSKLQPSHFIFEYMMERTVKNYISVDLLELIYIPLKEPLLFKPFDRETLFDLMFHRLKIYLALDLDKLMELFNMKGMQAKWLSKKATNRYLSKTDHKPFVYKGQAIEVTTSSHTVILGTTFTVNLLLDNLTPSALVNRYASMR